MNRFETITELERLLEIETVTRDRQINYFGSNDDVVKRYNKRIMALIIAIELVRVHIE